MILSRYLARDIATASLAVITILLFIFLSQQMVRYLNYIAVGKIPINLLLTLVGFEAPYLLALLLPLALYLGILIALGKCYANGEMMVMFLSGYSVKRLLCVIASIAFVVASVIGVLMLWVNPFISAQRATLINQDRNINYLIHTLIPGRFQMSHDAQQVIYAEKLSRDHLHAENIFIAKASENNERWMLVHAKEGEQVWDAASKATFFISKDGYRYEGSPGQNDYRLTQFKQYAIRLSNTMAAMTHLSEDTLTLTTLWHNYFNPKYAAELQWRFSIGLSALLLALLAVPLSALKTMHKRYFMLLPAAIVYVVYIDLLFVAKRWLEQGTLSIAMGLWWVHGVMLLFVLLVYYNQMMRWVGYRS